MTKIQFCEICYTNEIDPNKKCANFFPCTCIEQKYCDTCIADWVQQSFKKHQLMKDFKIKCMNSECKKDILFEAFVEYFTFNDSLCELTLINTTAFHHYLSHQEDVRACPSEGCSYRGVINLKACRDNLVCEICNKEWRDISQISNWEHFTMKLKNMTRFNFETLTHLHNLIFEEPCPRCGMLIQKNGGCNHMMCAKCNHEFCWWCLDSYYHYVHGGMRFCPYRYAAVIGSVIMAIFLLNQKLVYIYSTLFAIQWFILYNLGAFVLLKAFLGSFIFYGFFIDEYKRDKSNRVAYGRSYMSKCKIITLSILFVILLSSHLTIIYISVSNNFTWRCLEILYYELMLGLIIGGCYLLFLGGRWGIRYSRFVFKRYILRQANYNFDGTYTQKSDFIYESQSVIKTNYTLRSSEELEYEQIQLRARAEYQERQRYLKIKQDKIRRQSLVQYEMPKICTDRIPNVQNDIRNQDLNQVNNNEEHLHNIENFFKVDDILIEKDGHFDFEEIKNQHFNQQSLIESNDHRQRRKADDEIMIGRDTFEEQDVRIHQENSEVKELEQQSDYQFENDDLVDLLLEQNYNQKQLITGSDVD
eukprot:403353657